MRPGKRLAAKAQSRFEKSNENNLNTAPTYSSKASAFLHRFVCHASRNCVLFLQSTAALHWSPIPDRRLSQEHSSLVILRHAALPLARLLGCRRLAKRGENVKLDGIRPNPLHHDSKSRLPVMARAKKTDLSTRLEKVSCSALLDTSEVEDAKDAPGLDPAEEPRGHTLARGSQDLGDQPILAVAGPAQN